MAFGGGSAPSPLLGLLLNSDTPPTPGLVSPPMNSLPPRLWPPRIGFEGVADRSSGDCGGDVPVLGCAAPDGLKEKAGRAFMDFLRWWGMDPRRPVGYAWRDIGRVLEGVGSEEEVSGPRMGNENSGLGMSSMGPALDG